MSYYYRFLQVVSILATFFLAVRAHDHLRAVKIDENIIKLPLSVNFNKNYAKTLLESDRTRVRTLLQNAMRSPLQGFNSTLTRRREDPSSVSATNNAIQYTVAVNIGNPSTQYNLLIDTGSSNTWVGANKAYVPTSTSHKTKNKVSVIYGSGDFSGTEYLDQVVLGPSLLIRNQSIGVATKYDGFGNIDGILGMGPVGLTAGTLSPDTSRLVPTIVEKLFAQKSIPRNSFSVYFSPTNLISDSNGELTFGGIDTKQLSANITYTPIPTEGAASRFLGLRQSIIYGESKEIITNGAGFCDTGTTLLLLNDDAFDNYVASINASLDPTVGLLQIPKDQFPNLKSLHFIITYAPFFHQTKFEFTPNAQIWPRSLNTAIGGSNDKIYLIVSSLGSAVDGAPDVQFVNGYAFLERFYTTYDLSKRQVGIAPTKFTYAEMN